MMNERKPKTKRSEKMVLVKMNAPHDESKMSCAVHCSVIRIAHNFQSFFSSSLSFVLVASSLFLMWHYKKIWSEMNKEPMYKPTHFYCRKWAHRLWLFCVAVKERKFVSCLLWMHHSHDRCGAFTAVTMHSIHIYLVSLKHFSLQTT